MSVAPKDDIDNTEITDRLICVIVFGQEENEEEVQHTEHNCDDSMFGWGRGKLLTPFLWIENRTRGQRRN